jgi:tRNA(Ile2) C34 agmatinyltransferase TiaS
MLDVLFAIFIIFIFGILIGLPIMIILGIFFTKKKICPVCGYTIKFLGSSLGIDCLACKSRLVIRNGNLYTPEQAKNLNK